MLFRRTSTNAQSRRALVADARPLEVLEDRRLMSVTSLSLYNAVDDVPYGTLNEGASVSFVQLNTWGITLKAETSGAVGSVRWAFDGNSNYATENFAPYAIAGDTDGGNLSPWAPPSVGTHTVKVTAFTGQNGTGSVINSLTRTFTVTDQPFGPGGAPVVAGPTVTFSDPSADGSEQNLDPGIWTIARTGSTASGLTVNYAVGGSASNGVDYNRLSGSIVIPAGRTSVDLIVKPIQDSAVEGTEDVVVTLATSGSYALTGAITATSPIFDNDKVSSPTPTPTPSATGVNDITWSRSGPRAPEPKTEAGVVQVGSKIYSIGGFTAKGGTGTFFPLTRRVYSYDMATRQYKELAALPSQAAGNHFGVASDGQNIYAVAGQLEATYGKGTSTAWKYNIATNKWTQFNSLPQIRFGGVAFIANGVLHFVGGDTADRRTVSTDHWSINLSNTSAGWQKRASIPLGGDHMSHANINGRHFLFGGEHSHKGLNGSGGGEYIQHNYTFEYNVSNDTWTRKANMPLAVSHIEGSTLVIGGRAVLIGGLLDGGDSNTTSRVQVYDPGSNTWKSLTTRYPKRIIGASSGYWNGKIYMSEGFSPDESDRQVGFEGTVKFG